jgi:peptidoglycan/xylan/chitin deacetylase (PgdA/CDA1 family)
MKLIRPSLLALNALTPVGAVWAASQGQTVYGLLPMMATHAASLWATLQPPCDWWGPVITHQAAGPENNQVWLTLDDGPDPEHTEPILDLLDQYQAQAGFFLIGEKVQRWPRLAQEIKKRGHIIGHHTQTHPAYHFWRLGPRALESELTVATQVLQDVVDETPTLFRAPAGMHNPFLHPLLAKHQLTLVGWSKRGLDGRDTDLNRIVQRVTRDVRSGDILLLHEGRLTSVESVRWVLETLKSKELRSGFTSLKSKKTVFDEKKVTP